MKTKCGFCWLTALFILPLHALAECKAMIASGNPEYPPYLWRSLENPQQLIGANELFMQRLSKEIGISIDVVYAGPWGRVQEEIAAGRIDLLAGAFHTSSRAERMDYLQPPFQSTRTSVWVHQGKPFEFKGLDDLRNRQGVTVLYNSFGQEFDDYSRQHLKIYQVGSLEQGFRMLEDQRVDYVIYEDAPGVAYANKIKVKNLTTLPKAVSGESLYLTMSKHSQCNTPDVRKKIENTLRQAEREGWMIEYIAQAQKQWRDTFSE